MAESCTKKPTTLNTVCQPQNHTTSRQKLDTLLLLVAFLYFPHLGSILGSQIPSKSMDDWYLNLVKPNWAPVSTFSREVSTFLYSTLGVASYLAFILGGGSTGRAKWSLLVYLCYILLNWLWPPVFFGFHSILGGFQGYIIFIILLLMTLLLMYLFGRIYIGIAVLFLPYVTWVIIACTMNGCIYHHN